MYYSTEGPASAVNFKVAKCLYNVILIFAFYQRT